MKNLITITSSVIVSGVIVFSLILISNNATTSYAEYISPKKQLESGILSNDIICRENKVLVERDNGKVACVKESNVEKLGWTMISNTNLIFENSFSVTVVTKQVQNETKVVPVEYNIVGGNITNIIDTGRCELNIDLDSSGQGNLKIKIPREVIDSRIQSMNYLDDVFIIYGDETLNFKEIQTTPTSRVLDIHFSNNTKLINILGLLQWDDTC